MVCVPADKAEVVNETLPFTRGALVASVPLMLSVTVTVLKAGSSFCVNQSVTSCGGAATLLPTRGSAWSPPRARHILARQSQETALEHPPVSG